MNSKFKTGIIVCISSLIMLSCTNTDSPSNDLDENAPTLELLGANDTVFIGMQWNDPGFVAVDDIDGNITENVQVNGSVRTEKPGIYTLTYSVSDKAGNTVEKTRDVYVALPSSLVAWYPFDNDARDYSGNNLNGTAKVNAALSTDRFGNLKNSYHFDGSSYIEVPYDNKLKLIDAFTVSVWAKSDISGKDYLNVDGKVGFVLDIGAGAEKDYGIYYYPDQGLTFRYNNTQIFDSLADIQKWHHYAMTYNGTRLSGYVDGKKIGSASVPKGTITENPLRIGCESKSVTRFWKGNIDDILIYSNALDSEQIYSLAHINAFIADTNSLPVDTSNTEKPVVVSGLKANVSGTPGNLVLTLSWTAVPDAFNYGVYYAPGKTVSKDDYYRIATKNSKTFSSELTEGTEYTFAVTFTKDSESALSDPVTVTFKLP